MQILDRASWEVLNATADDWENLEQIYYLVCLEFSPEGYENRDHGAFYLRPAKGAPSLGEIADRITDLVTAGLLAARQEDSGAPVADLDDHSYVWRAWFQMTPAGRSAGASSEHANLVEHEHHS